jgi:hypothetical protein
MAPEAPKSNLPNDSPRCQHRTRLKVGLQTVALAVEGEGMSIWRSMASHEGRRDWRRRMVTSRLTGGVDLRKAR